MTTSPSGRIALKNDAPLRADGEHVLYWMIAARRTRWSFALDHAISWAMRLGKPLVVLEPLRCAYLYASDRIHRFVIDGMADQARRFEGSPIVYYPYVESQDGAGRGLLEAWAARACVVVTDDFPHFFLPRMVDAAARRLRVRLEAVDGNGILPIRAADRDFPSAQVFRRFLQRNFSKYLEFPSEDPLPAAASLPRAQVGAEISGRWPATNPGAVDLDLLPIDHSVPVVEHRPGGEGAGRRALARFLRERLGSYAADHNHPDAGGASGLSPYFHFGHISAHEVFRGVLDREGAERFNPDAPATGRRGWFGLGEDAEAFLDEAITWRELGLNHCAQAGEDCARYDTLPEWARQTMATHRHDRREHVYTREELSAARTHDRIWNAAQTELLREGRIHNYLRMLWGKKIFEWSRDPRAALAVMLELNDRYALDGRDPNSVSGVTWVLGRYDRPWGPERPIFGTLRYMTSASTARKLQLEEYLERYSPADG